LRDGALPCILGPGWGALDHRRDVEGDPKPAGSVWRALVTPNELIRWDERRISLEAPIPDYPAPGRSARWRCWLGSLNVEHCEDPLEVVPPARLRCAVRIAAFEFEETYTLADQAPDATRLSLRLIANNTLPLLSASSTASTCGGCPRSAWIRR